MVRSLIHTRGFCPSCGARRMIETAAHLVDHVIPQVQVRQWVLSFPIPLRFMLATHPQLLSPVLQVTHRAISTFLIKQTGLKRAQVATGAITLRLSPRTDNLPYPPPPRHPKFRRND